MKASKLGALLGCMLAAMAACSPYEGGSNGLSSRDAGANRDSNDAGRCTAALAGVLGAGCATCVQNNCDALIASCTASNCAKCLLGCTTCLSACTDHGSSADAGSSGDGGVPSRPAADGGVPSCDRIRNGNCCSYAALANLETQCQQALDANSEAICASLLSQTRDFLGYCK